MKLIIQELIHFMLSIIVGFFVWQISDNSYALLTALMGGFFIDFDHLLDYFLAFGIKFNLIYFLKGYQFLKTDKIYVIFHSWELSIVLLFISFLVNSTIVPFFVSFSLSLFFHLVFDVLTNNMFVKSYCLLYRVQNNFELKTMVTNEHYQKHIKQKSEVIF